MERQIVQYNKGWFSRTVLSLNTIVLAGVWVLGITLLISNQVLAQSEEVETFKTTSNGKTVICGLVDGDWVPGSVKRKSGKFVPLKDRLRSLKRRARKASASRRQAQRKKIKRLRSQLRQGLKVCRAGPTDSEETPESESPSPTKAPTATATPTGSDTDIPDSVSGDDQGSNGGQTGNFDDQGNVTTAGKAAFGIPSSLAANLTRGRQAYDSTCKSCHLQTGELGQGQSFSTLRQSLAGVPMFFTTTTLPDQTLADITAYLNRFNQ